MSTCVVRVSFFLLTDTGTNIVDKYRLLIHMLTVAVTERVLILVKETLEASFFFAAVQSFRERA